MSCAFCDRAAAEYREDHEIMVFEPLDPVTPGHLLVVPVLHLEDFGDVQDWHDADAKAAFQNTMWRASKLARDLKVYEKTDCNIITSAGANATQTVFHLHVHLVPRRENDGLTLPWTGQKK